MKVEHTLCGDNPLRWLPSAVRVLLLVLFGFATIHPEQTQAQMHGPAALRTTIDGIWDIEDEGSVKIADLTMAINRQWAGIGMRSASTPLTGAGFVRYAGNSHYNEMSGTPVRAQDGTITMSFGQFGYCNCSTIDYTMRPTADPDVMIGEWYFDENERGRSTWRRRGPVRIEAVSYFLSHADPSMKFVRDRVAYPERPLNAADWPRAYGPRIYVNILGRGFAGGHDVWLEPDSKLQISEAAWLCQDGNSFDYGADWTRCGGPAVADLGVAGLRIRLDVAEDITAGIKTLWVDGQRVHMYFPAINPPTESQLPELVLLDAVNMEGEQITGVEEGVPFMVKAVFDGDHPERWISVNILGPDGTAQANPSPQVVLRRTEDLKVFESDWIAVEASSNARNTDQ